MTASTSSVYVQFLVTLWTMMSCAQNAISQTGTSAFPIRPMRKGKHQRISKKRNHFEKSSCTKPPIAPIPPVLELPPPYFPGGRLYSVGEYLPEPATYIGPSCRTTRDSLFPNPRSKRHSATGAALVNIATPHTAAARLPVAIQLDIAAPAPALPGILKERPLPLPASVNRSHIRWAYASSILSIHLIALLAFVPWFFSWTGLALCIAGLYIFGTLGINLCFHRLLTHRSFTCSKRTEQFLALLGVCCLQEGPGRWVSIHRRHHQHSDEQPDPHSPLVTFLWGHVGWLIVENKDTDSFHLYQKYARDLLTQPFYLNMERNLRWLWVYLAHIAIYAAFGLALGGLLTHTWPGALKMGASIVLWGVVVRTVLVWHITWSVNSLSHLFGYASHATGENSKNNWFVALISNGEGWHNNHHADQRSAAHGHKWWELDITYLSILLMEKLGLAANVKRHDRHEDHPLEPAPVPPIAPASRL